MTDERKGGLLITGASGQLGGYLLRELAGSETTVTAWSGSRTGSCFGYEWQRVDLTNPKLVAAAFRQVKPAAIIHAAALGTGADCWRNAGRAFDVNVRASAFLAELAHETNARLLFVSTDLVFDGERGEYVEEDSAAPLSVYGRTKVEAEKAILKYPGHVVVRLSLLFGTSVVGRPTFLDQLAASLRKGQPCTLYSDEWRSPLDYATAARALLQIVHSDVRGRLHVGGPERMTRLEMGLRLAQRLEADPAAIVRCGRNQNPAPEPRPRDVSLSSTRWRAAFPDSPWPEWNKALEGVLAS